MPNQSSIAAHLKPCLVWWPICLLVGAAVAWVAFVVQAHFAPILLFPLLIGVMLGGCLGGMLRLLPINGKGAVFSGVIVGAMMASGGQHFLAYRQELASSQKDLATLEKARMLFPELADNDQAWPPSSFLRFLRQRATEGRPITANFTAQGPLAWGSWAMDAGLLLLAAGLTLLPAMRQPYCRRCGSWYHTSRTGPLPSSAVAPLIELLDWEPVSDVTLCAYRLITCRAGCSPTGFELRCRTGSGRPVVRQAWLDTDQRNDVVRQLDALNNE